MYADPNHAEVNKGELPPLRSVYSTNLPEVLHELGVTLLVTTYQAGKLVIVRADGGTLNTHFRAFNQPMGLAVGKGRLAVGTEQEIIEFRNVPAAAKKLKPADKHDACYLPKSAHLTGNVLIHEMSYAGGELWFVNSQFSCVCTLDGEHSFVPRWRPSFITHLAPGDSCHLNGLAMFEDQPRWVTALGECNESGQWRQNKRDGGILIDMQFDQIIARGLSMPHSPRWYQGRLWLLESGTGSLGHLEQTTGKYEPIVRLKGFTRGLDFCGKLAFVGLSQVRETAVFSGIEITETLQDDERNCGVWVIDISSGQIIAFLKFQDALQEIFAVSVLHNMRFPDLINDDPELTGNTYVLPDESMCDVPSNFQSDRSKDD